MWKHLYFCPGQWKQKSDAGQAGKNWGFLSLKTWGRWAWHSKVCGEQDQELTGFLESAPLLFSVGLISPISSEDHSCTSGVLVCLWDLAVFSLRSSFIPSFPAAHPVPRLSQPRPLPHLRETKRWQWATSQLVDDILNIGCSFYTKLVFKHPSFVSGRAVGWWDARDLPALSCAGPAKAGILSEIWCGVWTHPVHVGWQGSSFWLVIQDW